MAFYVSQVDENGREIARRITSSSRPTFATASEQTQRSNTSRTNIQTISYQSNLYAYKHTMGRASSSSPAKHSNSSGRQQSSFRCASNDLNCGKGKTLRSSDDASSNIVPPLGLDLHDVDYYDPDFGGLGLRSNRGQAYENWLSAKRKASADRAAKCKQLAAQKQHAKEERVRLAAEKYKLWLQRKKVEQAEKAKVQWQQEKEKAKSNKMQRFASLTLEERAKRLQLWQKSKKVQSERNRLLNIAVKALHRHHCVERRRLADEAFLKWMANIDGKPKPVPLNRGLFSLRGTVSKIFINPKEWQHI